MLISVRSHDNKLCLFLLNVHAMQDAKEKRLISSSDYMQLKHHKEPTLNPRKNTKNRITCLKFFMVAVWILICLDMKYLRFGFHKVSQKIIENSEYSSEFN